MKIAVALLGFIDYTFRYLKVKRWLNVSAWQISHFIGAFATLIPIVFSVTLQLNGDGLWTVESEVSVSADKSSLNWFCFLWSYQQRYNRTLSFSPIPYKGTCLNSPPHRRTHEAHIGASRCTNSGGPPCSYCWLHEVTCRELGRASLVWCSYQVWWKSARRFNNWNWVTSICTVMEIA